MVTSPQEFCLPHSRSAVLATREIQEWFGLQWFGAALYRLSLKKVFFVRGWGLDISVECYTFPYHSCIWILDVQIVKLFRTFENFLLILEPLEPLKEGAIQELDMLPLLGIVPGYLHKIKLQVEADPTHCYLFTCNWWGIPYVPWAKTHARARACIHTLFINMLLFSILLYGEKRNEK